MLEGVDDDLTDVVSSDVKPGDTLDTSSIDSNEAAIDSKMADASKEVEADVVSPEERAKDSFAEMKTQIEQSISQSNETLSGWAEKMHEFLSFLNDASNPDSIKSVLDNSSEGSPISAIKGSISNTVVRIAQQVASLEQQLRAQVGNTTVKDVMSQNQ